MLTRIIVSHESVEALKASPLWSEVMKVFMAGGDFEVCEISAMEDEDDVDDECKY